MIYLTVSLLGAKDSNCLSAVAKESKSLILDEF